MKNTSSHGFELGFIVSGGAKHEYQIMSEPIGNKAKIVSRKTELSGGLEVAAIGNIPAAIVIKQEIDHLTGDIVMYIAVNGSGKFGSFLVFDLTALESGFKIRIPNKK